MRFQGFLCMQDLPTDWTNIHTACYISREKKVTNRRNAGVFEILIFLQINNQPSNKSILTAFFCLFFSPFASSPVKAAQENRKRNEER